MARYRIEKDFMNSWHDEEDGLRFARFPYCVIGGEYLPAHNLPQAIRAKRRLIQVDKEGKNNGTR